MKWRRQKELGSLGHLVAGLRAGEDGSATSVQGLDGRIQG